MTATPEDDIPAIPRILNLRDSLSEKSHFLLGPRQTGKSFLIKQSLQGIRTYDLLDSSTYLTLSRDPGRIEGELNPGDQLVVIDEIQWLPELLNEVHRLIESRGIRFLMTGSSARKLRRGGINLLGGRARTKYLYPLTQGELGKHFDLATAVSRGTLPSIYFSGNAEADLEAYAGSYLQQEIVAEGATRNFPAFSRFLRIAALCNSTIVNYTKVGNDAQVARTTVYEYFDILKDTLILHELPAWRRTIRRKPIASSKFYFFDVGVAGHLQGRPFRAGTPEFGQGFETLLMHELRCFRDYRSGEPLTFWRSTSGFEVDFIIGDHTAVEAKASSNVTSDDLKSLRALSEEGNMKRLICVTLERTPRTVGGIRLLPLRVFLDELWRGTLS
jgi:predicted AAA+ superfamily ATPase